MFFYKCIDNCKICKEANKHFQCDPEYRLDSNDECEERIEGCGVYDNTLSYFDIPTNNNGKVYNIYIECNKIKGFYCFGNNKIACKKMTDDNNTYFDNDIGCKEKCEKFYSNIIVVIKLIVTNANQAII